MFEECLDGWVGRSVKALEFFAIFIEEDHGREAIDLEFFGERFIFGSDFRRSFREVEFNQDEFFGGFGDELFFGEHVFAHGDAGRAPVRSCEFHEDGFVLIFCILNGFLKISAPAFRS